MSSVEEVMDISELKNAEILDRWYGYLTGVGQGAMKTYETYKTQISKLVVWCEHFHPTLNILQLSKGHIKTYFAYIMEKEYARDSVKLNVHAIRSFYRWAADEEEVIEHMPVPHKISVKGKRYKAWVPTCKQVLEMRTASVNRVPALDSHGRKLDYMSALARCTFNELLTTTGIRISEVEQLRVDSLDFGATVYDQEERCKSRFVGGSIYIDGYHIGTKQYKEKVVWFSVLAGKLLRLYIRKSKIAGNTPLFPWSRRTLQGWVTQAGKGIVNEEIKQVKRSKYFTDITPQQLAAMPPAIRQRVLRRQQAGAKLDAHAERANKHYAEKLKQMKPHAFRHFNACMLYHRGWTGTRHDLAYVRDCLGHSSKEQSLEYITKSTAINDDRDWRRVMLGDAKSYWHLFHHFRD